MLNAVFVFLGIAMLSLGGESLIRGALAAAHRLGVSPLLSGLVIVGFGTSTPELAVSVEAAISAAPDIAIGNVVGSNIGNILLILGICAVITPLTVQPMALRRDAVAVVAASVGFSLLATGDALGRADGVILLLALGAYLLWTWLSDRAHHQPAAALHEAESQEIKVLPVSTIRLIGTILLGLALLIGGSHVLLLGATGLATHFGIPDSVIGLTVVAVGTSLPELSVSAIAAVRRHADVVVGNILGSNIFNVLGILGISALLQPLPIATRILQFDQWIMLGTAVLVLLFLYSGHRLTRGEGAILLLGYGIYLALTFSFFAA